MMVTIEQNFKRDYEQPTWKKIKNSPFFPTFIRDTNMGEGHYSI